MKLLIYQRSENNRRFEKNHGRTRETPCQLTRQFHHRGRFPGPMRCVAEAREAALEAVQGQVSLPH